MRERKKNGGLNWLMTGPIGLGALMFSTYVGPGFASGTQTVSYMLTKGWIGVFIGPIIVGILTLIWCYLVNEFNRCYRPKNYREQSDMLFKTPWVRLLMGTFIDIMGILQIILVSAAMLSGAANLFNQMWGIPMAIGTLIFAASVVFLTLSGTSFVLKVGSVLTLCILAVTVYIAAVGLHVAWPATMEWLSLKIPPQANGFSTIGAWYTIITFMTTFVSGRNAAVSASLTSLRTRTDSWIAAWSNALMCTLSTLIYTVIFAAGMPAIQSESIPTLYALRDVIGASKGSQMVYVIIALAAMLSTAVSLMYGAIARFKQIAQNICRQSKDAVLNAGIVIVFIVISTAFSTIGIINLIGIGYTYLGYLQTPIMILLWYFAIPYRMAKDKKEGVLPAENVTE